MHDIYYVENWSLAFDFKILLLTLGHLASRCRVKSSAAPEHELETERLLAEPVRVVAAGASMSPVSAGGDPGDGEDGKSGAPAIGAGAAPERVS